MHVLCPSCATAYEIATLERPRRLRCARCGAEWRELPPAADAVRDPGEAAPVIGAPATAEAPFPDPDLQGPLERDALSMRPLPSRSARLVPPWLSRHEDALLLGCWILNLAVIAAALFAFWHWRGTIAHRWPPSLRLYRLLPRPPSG